MPRELSTMTDPVFRLAMRVEGDHWVAYLAKPQTMEGAREIARVSMGLVGDLAIKDKFISFCIDAMTVLLNDIGIKILGWDTQKAPEHERAGRA